MKWNKVTTDKFGDVLFWDGKEIVFIVSYNCFYRDRIFGNIGWILGFSSKDGLTKECNFCG